MGIINFLLFSVIRLKTQVLTELVVWSSLAPSVVVCIQIAEKFMRMLGTDHCFPSSSVVSHGSFLLLMGSTILFIVGGFGGCTGLEDCAPTVFSVVLSWLGGFFCGGFAVFQICFGGWAVFLMFFHGWAVFSAVLRCFFVLLMVLALPPLVFSAFLEVIRD
jgi:hypothetical protein